MNTLNRSRRAIEQKTTRSLGNLLSDDDTTRAVEIAFIKRYTKAAFKTSENLLRLGKTITPPTGKDDLQAQVTADHALMRSPAFATIARELGKSVPGDASFGKLRADGE